MAGGVVAAVLGPNLANWAKQALAVDFLGSYVSLALLYLASLALLATLRLPPPQAEHSEGEARPMGEILRQPSAGVALVAGMFGYGVMSFVMTATPLAMKGHLHPFPDTAFVIQWHVLGMFAPSFVTGHLIRRFGVAPIMWLGALAELACALINLHGTSLAHYWSALVLLGVGWNFLFVGATTQLTTSYRRCERAKVQALNDFLIFTTVTIASLSAGALQQQVGWMRVNQAMIPLVSVVIVALLWQGWRLRAQRQTL